MNLELKNSKNRIKIPSIGLDAPITYKKVLKNGIMPSPDTPDEIVYYDFDNLKGFGGKLGLDGNTILSGHVDSGLQACNYGTVPPPCHAVLWDLEQVKAGDEINIVYDGKNFKYLVYSNRQIKPTGTSWKNNIKHTSTEIISLMTCSGEFDFKRYIYYSRQVVKARRIKNI